MNRIFMPPWLPNGISTLRLALIPAWWMAATGTGVFDAPDRVAAFAVVLLMGASDVLDGYLARRFNLATTLGAALDATADKAAQIVVFSWLAVWPSPGFAPVPLWFLITIYLRDATMVIGLGLIWWRCRHVQARHRWHGKAASALVFFLMMAIHLRLPQILMTCAFATTAAVLLASTLLYARDGIEVLHTGEPQN